MRGESAIKSIEARIAGLRKSTRDGWCYGDGKPITDAACETARLRAVDSHGFSASGEVPTITARKNGGAVVVLPAGQWSIEPCLSGCHTRIAGATAKHVVFQTDGSVSSDAGAVVTLARICSAERTDRCVNHKRAASTFQELSMRNVSCTHAGSWQARQFIRCNGSRQASRRTRDSGPLGAMPS